MKTRLPGGRRVFGVFLFLVGHDDAAVGLGAGGEGGDVGHVLQGGVDHMALIGVHGLQGSVSYNAYSTSIKSGRILIMSVNGEVSQ